MRSLASRAALRYLCVGYLEAEPRSLVFGAGADGKPRLDGSHLRSGLTFNLSHSGRHILLAFARDVEVGVDVEALTTIPDLATDGSGYRKTPFWVKPGLRGNRWQALRTEVGKIPELRFSTGYLAGTTLAATRTEPGQSGIILNAKG